MRWPATFSLCLLLEAWGVSASLSHDPQQLPTVYLYDPRSPSPSYDTDSTPVDPRVASLIIARRLGLGAYHSVGGISDIGLQQLNKYTKPANVLFDNVHSYRGAEHIVIVVNTAGPLEDSALLSTLTTFQLSRTPRLQDEKELLDSLYDQALAEYGQSKPSSSHLDGVLSAGALEQQRWKYHPCGDERLRIYMQIYEAAGPAEDAGSLISEIIRAAQRLETALTIILNPNPASVADAGENVFGKAFSNSQKLLQRRQEELLSEPIDVAQETSTSTSAAQPPATNVAAFPLTPQCYDSSESCESETNSCSGHGKCVLTRKSAGSGDDDSAECYQCRCEPQVVRNDDGSTKKMYYGGSACHKKDISAPFWILTLTAGSLIALVGFGISMLVAMGNAELPSVIGAGVSGPRAK